jgi:DNA-directed RNA polymerase omega subunit
MADEVPELSQIRIELVARGGDWHDSASRRSLFPKDFLAESCWISTCTRFEKDEKLIMATTQKSINEISEVNPGLKKVDSIYRLIIVAGLRSKQLMRGSKPRIETNPLKRRNTSIALEEVRQGLVPFTIGNRFPHLKKNGAGE